MSEASWRPWRIGQTRPVKVAFMAYRNTLQADALKLVAKKLQSSPAEEGELPEAGLAACGDDGDDLILALARKIIRGEEDAESVEAVFAQAGDAAASPEEYPVDDGWKLVEPEVVGVHVNGANGNGHANGNRNGHAREPDEGQQSLFSWAEFLTEEPVKRRIRKPKPASTSL